ncbi:MOSC domain-containing protein [Actomonas aquatica]|uniref:MOSC domain-containing protein n=1 Tax=Actomonas aquatica TaxID=2866162 RepID=A0ABZ1C4K7_9BACT|nr:MOSC domain-containing protein [Opitutus sp. WL0086]WRQ86560.1 MOSC domain-containing protein [Opitutus sp. WL0086]
MPAPIGHLRHVLTGRIAPLSRPGASSAIDKKPVAGPVAIEALGLFGDEQADRRVHGGPDKAVLLYSIDHYAAWRTELGPLPRLNRPGAFGENLAVAGLSESDVCLGDRWRVGKQVTLEITQGRQPCWKLADRFDVPDMVQRVHATLRTGWYARVLKPGSVAVGDSLTCLARPHPRWPIRRLTALLYHESASIGDLASALTLPLPDGWRRRIAARLGWTETTDTTDDLRIHGPMTR